MEILPPVVAVFKLTAGCAMGKVVFPAPCSSVSHLPLRQPLFYRTFKPWKEREQVLFPELLWGIRGAELWPSFPLWFRGGRSAEPSPRLQDMAHVSAGVGATLSQVALPLSSPSLLVRTSNCLQTYKPNKFYFFPISPQNYQVMDTALGRGLSVQSSHNPSVPASPAWHSWGIADVNLGVLLNYYIM